MMLYQWRVTEGTNLSETEWSCTNRTGTASNIPNKAVAVPTDLAFCISVKTTPQSASDAESDRLFAPPH